MVNLQEVSLLDLIPPNLRSDEGIRAAAQAIDAELRQVTNSIRNITYMDRLDSLTHPEADELAWQYHVDFYNPALPLEQKRELVKKSFAWHRRKGTPSAVEELVTTIFGSGQVVEWFQYGGQPYHFKVLTSDPAATGARAQEFIDAVVSVKNARSWLESIEITTATELPFYIGHALHTGDYITIRQVV